MDNVLHVQQDIVDQNMKLQQEILVDVILIHLLLNMMEMERIQVLLDHIHVHMIKNVYYQLKNRLCQQNKAILLLIVDLYNH